MTITIQVDGKNLTTLQRQAATLGVPVERMAEVIVQRHLQGSSKDDPAFRKIMEDTFRENEELYRRLAK